MSDKPISIIYDHYKDTCSIIGEAIKRRDRSMLYVVLVLSFFAFQTISPANSILVVNDFLNFKFGLSLGLNISVIANIVWFLLLIFTLRYFQVAVFVERQYVYLHKAEDAVNKELKEELITREGKSYLEKYPLFSNWMWMLYTIVFPLLLLGVAATKITGELRYVWISGWAVGSILDSIAFVLLVVSVVLYLTTLHKKSKDK
jgi:hypothetical protein